MIVSMNHTHPTAEAIARYVRDCCASQLSGTALAAGDPVANETSTASSALANGGADRPPRRRAPAPVDSTSPATVVDDRLCRVLKHINARLAEHLDLDEIAATVCIPRRTLTWLVRRELGCSAGELVTWLRLQKAQELLTTSTKPITEVALDAGYSSANKMANHFTRYLGVSPREYRARLARSASEGFTPARSVSEGFPRPAPSPAPTNSNNLMPAKSAPDQPS